MQIPNPIKNEDIIWCAKEAALRAGYQNPRNPNVQPGKLGRGEVYVTKWSVTMEVQKQSEYIPIKLTVLSNGRDGLFAETIIDEIR